jgi:hypothetical protein
MVHSGPIILTLLEEHAFITFYTTLSRFVLNQRQLIWIGGSTIYLLLAAIALIWTIILVLGGLIKYFLSIGLSQILNVFLTCIFNWSLLTSMIYVLQTRSSFALLAIYYLHFLVI